MGWEGLVGSDSEVVGTWVGGVSLERRTAVQARDGNVEVVRAQVVLAAMRLYSPKECE